MKDKKRDIGFNRKVKALWLRDTLKFTAAGVPVEEIEEVLKTKIGEKNSGKETIRKVFIYLRRVWIEPPDYCTKMRDDALEMYRKRPDADCAFLLNWGMSMAAYPFIAHVAAATGRLLRLQGEAQASQVNLRIRENFGDRHFVYRSVRYNLSTFLDAGAVKASSKKGNYLRGKIYQPRTDEEISWIVESMLHAQENTNIPFQLKPQHGAFFPFNMNGLTIAALKNNPRIEIFRHGMNEELVGLSI